MQSTDELVRQKLKRFRMTQGRVNSFYFYVNFLLSYDLWLKPLPPALLFEVSIFLLLSLICGTIQTGSPRERANPPLELFPGVTP